MTTDQNKEPAKAESVPNLQPVAILGNPHSGKTSLMVHLMRESGFQQLYLLGYPGHVDGMTTLKDLRDLSRISHCAVGIDEIDDIIPLYDKKANSSLKRLLKYAYHNHIKLFINTQLSQFITKMVSALVPLWCITELDIFELKNGSKPKRILLDYLRIPEVINKEIGMRLPVGQYVWYDDYAQAGENGIRSFPDPVVAKAWGNQSVRDNKRELDSIKKCAKYRDCSNLDYSRDSRNLCINPE